MIDRRRRDAMAELLRHFVAGRLTNDEFEERLDVTLNDPRPVRRWEDAALWAIRSRAWFLYDDLRTHRMKGEWAPSREGRSELARWVLFLYSDSEYEWPIRDFISLSSCLMNLLTLGLAQVILSRLLRQRHKAMGDWDVWPFVRRSDYEKALEHPRLLAG